MLSRSEGGRVSRCRSTRQFLSGTHWLRARTTDRVSSSSGREQRLKRPRDESRVLPRAFFPHPSVIRYFLVHSPVSRHQLPEPDTRVVLSYHALLARDIASEEWHYECPALSSMAILHDSGKLHN